MFAGYFLGLYLAFGLVIIGIEFYFFILSPLIEKDFTDKEAIVLIPCAVISLTLFIKSFSSENMFLMGFFSFLPLPVADATIKTIARAKEKIQEKIKEEKELKNWFYTIEKQPDNLNAYVEIGNIYFKRKDYEKALEFYRKAQNIMNMPYVMEKIKITEKELKIQKGIVWVCPECSFDNPGDIIKCKVCGYSKMDGNLLKDIKHQKREIFKATALIIFGPLAVILFVCLYIIMPPYLALIFTLFVIYLTIRFFTTY